MTHKERAPPRILLEAAERHEEGRHQYRVTAIKNVGDYRNPMCVPPHRGAHQEA